MDNRTLATARWLRQRYRAAGPMYVVKRAVQAWCDGGMSRLLQHYLHANASAKREGRYQEWIRSIEPSLIAGEIKQYEVATDRSGPTFSIVVPMYNTPPWMIKKCIQSVQNQLYNQWELCMVDDASPDDAGLIEAQQIAATDERIHINIIANNLGIALATNEAIAMATGDYIVMLDHDDELAPHALLCCARRIIQNPRIDFIYSDEDKIDNENHRHGPAFKPGISPHFLLSSNYVCHMAVYRREMVEAVGKLRSGFDGAQDYDFVLRFLEQAECVTHIAQILYHWRAHSGSTAGLGDGKPYAIEAGRAALESAMKRQNVDAIVDDGPFILTYQVRPKITSEDTITVLLHNLHGSACKMKRYLCGADLVAEVQEIEEYKECMHALNEVCEAASNPESTYILVVDADLMMDSSIWLEKLLEIIKLPGAGIVSPKIIDAIGHIEDSGCVYIEESQTLEKPYKGVKGTEPGYLWSLITLRNVTLSSEQCYLINAAGFIDAKKKWKEPINDFVTLCAAFRSSAMHALVAGDIALHRHTIRQQNNAKDEEILSDKVETVFRNAALHNPNIAYIEEAYNIATPESEQGLTHVIR